MDFQDTAAVLANCDLLISADSAVVSGRRYGDPNLACTALDSRMAMGPRGNTQPGTKVSVFSGNSNPSNGDWEICLLVVIRAMIATWIKGILKWQAGVELETKQKDEMTL